MSDYENDVFLSFATPDEEIALIVSQVLSWSGLRVFWFEDPANRQHGVSFMTRIDSSLLGSKHFVLIASPAAFSSRWVNLEYQAFLDRCYKSGERLLIPLLVGDFQASDLPPMLGSLLSCSTSRKDWIPFLVQALGGKALADPDVNLASRYLARAVEHGVLAHKSEQLESALESIKQENARRSVDFSIIKNDKVAGYLEEMATLHNEIGRATNFDTTSNLVVRWLTKHHMKNYVDILEGAARLRRIPLPSLQRRLAAIEAISTAKQEINAVSIWSSDQWLTSGLDYAEANLQAAERGVQIRRVVVVASVDELADARSSLESQMKHDLIELRYVMRDELNKPLEVHRFALQNILVCDKKIMTRSTDYSTHEGELTLNPIDIDKERERFKVIWAHVKA